jgi:hypothetical protein
MLSQRLGLQSQGQEGQSDANRLPASMSVRRRQLRPLHRRFRLDPGLLTGYTDH